MHVTIKNSSVAGRGKPNEDCLIIKHLEGNRTIVAISDGMGGLGNADIASRIASESVVDFAENNCGKLSPDILIKEALAFANAQVDKECYYRMSRLGCAIAMVLATNDTMFFSTIGNVRVYLIENGTTRTLLSHDDILEGYNNTNYLTHCLDGNAFRKPIEVFKIELSCPMEIEVCTDGHYESNDYDDASFVRLSWSE